MTPLGGAANLPRMNQGKNKSSGSRETSKQGPPLALIIVLAVAGGVIIGSAGTYYATRPSATPAASAAPAASGTPPAQGVTITPQASPQGQFTPAPQPPGEAPPGKVWSPEHGHWHDAPAALTPPAAAAPSVTPGATPAPATPPAAK